MLLTPTSFPSSGIFQLRPVGDASLFEAVYSDKEARFTRPIWSFPNLHPLNGSSDCNWGAVLLSPPCVHFIHFLPRLHPSSPTVSLNLIERKKKREERGRHPPSSASLASPCSHGACQGGEGEECNGAIYRSCCRYKKKSFSVSPSPLSSHPSSLLKDEEERIRLLFPRPACRPSLSLSTCLDPSGLLIPLFRCF